MQCDLIGETPVSANAADLKTGGGLKGLLYRPPWVGLMAFAIVFLFQGLGIAIILYLLVIALVNG